MTASSQGAGGSAPADAPTRPARPALRPDIQGLRAIAVLTVIVSHAGFGPLEGGFVGVDVFFVISGFLISQLLFREVRRDGRVSLSGFYARRARRILPAATVVTVVTVAGATLLTNLADARTVLGDAIWATFFGANIRFATSGVDYFAQDQGPSPLQHYWSLAVEEQFYLVWPLLLLLIVLGVRRRRAAGRRADGPDQHASGEAALPTALLARVLAVLCVVSLAWSVVATTTSPETAYFSTLARAWELGIGALAALAGPALVRHLTMRARGLLSAAGLVAIAVACLLLTESTPFPGVAALLPVLGSAAVLLAGIDMPADREVPGAIRGLGVAPMRVVGDWSYSLYLWHWPILVIGAAWLGRDLGPVAATAGVALAFVLAGLTYRFVETPFRSARRVPRVRALLLYPVSVAVVLAVVSGGWFYAQWAGGELGDNPAITVSDVADTAAAQGVSFSEDPYVAAVQAGVLAARDDLTVPSNLSPDLLALRDDIAGVGDCDYEQDVRDLCPRGAEDGDKTMVVLGDSHGRAWIPALEQIGEEAGYTNLYLVKVQCTAADVTVARLGSGEAWDGCTDFHEWTYEQIEELQPDLVVVSTSPPVNGVYIDGERTRNTDKVSAEMRAGYDRLFEQVSGDAGRVVLIKDVPKSPQDPATCMTDGRPSLSRCMFSPVKRSAFLAQQSIDAAQEAGVDVVDPRRWLCWDGSCPVVVGSTLTYRDPGHITSTYAGELAEPLGRAMGLLGPDSSASE